VPRGIEEASDLASLTQEISSQLRGHLRERLPDYMVPSHFLFLESLPLAPTGKVDRKALARLEPDAGLEVPRVEPRDLLELELVQIWQEVLGVPRLGVRDDFFESGGHSLLAVRLMAKVKERFGRDLPLAVLFQGGTVEALAALLRQEEAARSTSLLVPIQPFGSAQPFFCVHPAGGDVLCFAALARHLGPGQPFYGLRSRGLNGDEEPLERIEDMAALYLEEIRRVQPAGPYRLGGWSLGGLIAFEMARQLRERGEEVALVAILDTSPRIAGEGAGEVSDLDILVDIVRYLEIQRGRELGMTRADLEAVAPGERLGRLAEALRAADLVPPEVGEEELGRVARVYAANARATRLYVPKPYPDRVTLFRAGETEGPDADLGWGEISAGPVEVHAVPVTHLTLLVEPGVRQLAEQLRSRLEDVEPAAVLEPVG
jgi:thioesterase domain-containing protein/acyl carrier protein